MTMLQTGPKWFPKFEKNIKTFFGAQNSSPNVQILGYLGPDGGNMVGLGPGVDRTSILWAS